jgi:heptaprenyl diphosphate synthase
VTPSIPVARRSTLRSTLGLGEKLFASSEERHFADAIEKGLSEVEVGLAQELTFTDSLANVTGRYLLDAGGKRIRPVLTLVTAQLGRGNVAEVIMAAEAVEITHLASLYHDDVMDGALIRRGVPSAQTVWGNSVAILTGDLLFARAGKLIATLGSRATSLQAEVFERLCLGQLHETIGPADDEDPIEHYIQVLADKTGSLIALAAEVGVVFAEADESYRAPLVNFGEKIGVAFQLIDDVIDLSSATEETGKATGTDLRSGVATLPLLYLRELALTDASAANLLERVVDDESDDADFAVAVATLRDHEVTKRTLDEAHRWSRDAVESLEPLPDGPVKKALTRFADTIVERSS